MTGVGVSRVRSLLACAALALVVVAPHTALAQDEDEDDFEDDGDDEDSGDDGGDDEDGGEDEDDEEAVDKDQPAVTAGGLYSIRTYPIRELDRPLTISRGLTEVRAGVGVDVSAKQAFEFFGVSLEGRYGIRDHVELQAGFTSAYNLKQFGAYVGLEAALAYDFIDFRAALRMSRPAVAMPDPVDPNIIAYEGGDLRAGIDLGFPFRYVAKPEIAIVALDTLMTIDFDGKPDLNPSIGVSTNPIPPVSIVIFAQLQVIDFDTSAENFIIPATARVQFSPNRKLDLGAEFTFLNVKPPEPAKFYDNRFLTFYAQARF